MTLVQKVKGQSWTALEKQAEKIGEKNTNSNSLHILNSYYDKLKHKMPYIKNERKRETYAHSVEYSDFQLVLDVLKDSGAKPLFIIVPVHGKWYDYLGFPEARSNSLLYENKKTNKVRRIPSGGLF